MGKPRTIGIAIDLDGRAQGDSQKKALPADPALRRDALPGNDPRETFVGIRVN